MFACFSKQKREEKKQKKEEQAQRAKSVANLVQLEGFVKEVVDRHAGQKEVTITVQGIEDLPEDLKELLALSDVPDSVDMTLLLLCLNFLVKRRFKLKNEEGDEVEVPNESRKRVPRPVLPDTDTLLDSSDPSNVYRVGEMVGEGGFGSVYSAKPKKGKGLVAVKKMPHTSKDEVNQNLGEIFFLKHCDHPNIVKFQSAHIKGEEVWMLMEFMEGGTLTEAAVKHQFAEKQVAYVAQEVLKGLSYLHSKNVIHRDLKSPNIMLTTSGEVKLIDFGLCVDVSDGKMVNSMAGSPLWMPPEMIKGEDYLFKADIWSFGTCLIELLNQEPPFLLSGALKAMVTIGTEGHTSIFKKPDIWSADCHDFMAKCLSYDPAERPTADELLKHPFLVQADTQKGMAKILKSIFIIDTIGDHL